MTSTAVCPSCKVRLRLNKPLPGGATLKCPRCAKAFRLPEEEDAEERERLDDSDDEERPSRNRKRKGKGKKKAAGSTLYVLLGIGGSVVVAGVLALIVILNSGDGKGPLGGGDKPVRFEKEPERPPHPAAARLAGPADLALTADALGSEMRDGPAVKAAQAKYKGKIIALSGVVLGVSGLGHLKATYTLDVKGTSLIEVASTEPRPWEKVLPGQALKVNVMYWEHEPGQIGLVGGPIMGVTGTPRPTITAEAFGQEFQADPKAAEKKYQSRPHQILLLTGEVLEVHREDRDLPGWALKTGTAYRVKCFTSIGADRGLEPGMRIRMIGAFFGPSVENPTDLRVMGCWVFPSGK